MKKRWRNLLVLLAVCFAFIHMESDAQAEEVYTDGVYNYTLQENEFGDMEATITEYLGSAGNLTIPAEIDGNTVVAIAGSAFSERSDLYSVSIPDTVTRIGDSAFENDTNLVQVQLSKNLISLGGNVFGKCKNLTSIEIPKSLDDAYWSNGGPFWECSSLENVTFEEGTTEITKYLFYGCDGLKEITIPETVTRIEEYAFADCVSLKGIVVPDNVTEIGERAFAGCSNLASAEIGDGVVEIGTSAFENDINLTDVKLSKNLASLGGNVFGKCKNLTSIEIPKSLDDAYWSNGGPFWECSSLENVTFEEGTTEITKYLFYGCDGLKEITIPETVTKIEEYAFTDCVNLKGIVVPDSVTEIGERAFAGCSSMLSAEITDNAAENLGEYLFSGCSSLATVKLPKTQRTITSNMFFGCAGLSTIDLPETIERIEVSAFENAGLTTLEIPTAVTYVGEGAFKGNELLEKVAVLDSPVEFGNEVFRGCVLLNDVSLGKKLKSLGSYAFYGCDALTSVEVPDSATSIGDYCFAGLDLLADVKLGAGITEIPPFTFDLCPELKSIILPYRVRKISENAFTNCTNLSEVTIPQLTESIAENVFSYPQKMTIYGVEGSYAQEYAEKKGIAFQAIDKPAEKVTLSDESLTMELYEERLLILTIEPADFTDIVTWRSSDTNIVTVDETGLLRAEGLGTATVRVTVGSKAYSCTVTVVEPTTVQLDSGSLTMEGLDTWQLTATIRPESEAEREVQWSSSDENVATVDETGLVRALSKGTAEITAKVPDEEKEISATCKVTVTSTGHLAETVDDLESDHDYAVDTTEIWLYTSPDEEEPDELGVTFDAQTDIEENFDYLYIYDGEGNEIGRYTGTVLAGQTVTVPGGTVKIKLVSDEAGTAWGFKVTEITPVFGLQPQEITGTTEYSKVYGDPDFALDCILTEGSGELSYASDNESVAFVDADGNVTINGAGTAQITVTASASEGYQEAKLIVTVSVARAKQKLVVTYDADTLYVGESVRISASSETGKLSFTAEPESVATVDADGVVTGIAAGEVNITVISAGDENYEEAQKNISLTILEIPEESVSLEDCDVTLASETFVYDGTEKKPEVTVSYNDTLLTQDTDYTVSYEDNIQPGMARVVVQAAAGAGYYGVVEREFTIRPAMPEGATAVEPDAFSGCGDLYEANIGESVTQIGDRAFADCENLDNVYFSGNAPEMGEDVFAGDTLTAWYPADDTTWTRDKLDNYGGNVTWKAWDPETGEEAQRSLSFCAVTLQAGTYVYDGTPKTPAVTVTDGTTALVKDVDYSLSYSGNINAGAAAVTVQGIGAYAGTVTRNFTIGKAVPVLKFAADSIARTYGGAPFQNPLNVVETDGTVTYSSGNVNVAVVDGSGTVTIRGAGTAVITAQAAAGTNYDAGSASCTLTVAKAANTVTANDITKTWSKKQQSFQIGAVSGDGAALSYSSDNQSVTVDASGRVTVPKKFVGSARVTIQSAETANYSAARKAITVTVLPKGTSLKKVKSSTSKKMTVTWKKNADITGYEIQYSTSKDFTSNAKVKRVAKKKTVKLNIGKLKKGKKYYVRIRTYMNVGGAKYYSAWSRAKSVKIR